MLEFILNLIGDLISMIAVCFAAFLGAKYAIDTLLEADCEDCDGCDDCECCHNCQKPIYEPESKEE